MHSSPVTPIHDVVAMAVVVIRRDSRYRYEMVRLLTVDGQVWQLNEIAVPLPDKSLTLKAAAWTLKQERTGRWKHGHWHHINPKDVVDSAARA
jgi:hypothetical protein